MADWILQTTLSNLLISTLLAAVAWGVQRKSASIANLVWVLVLFKLLTPPMISAPLVPIESIASSSAVHDELGIEMEALTALSDGGGADSASSPLTIEVPEPETPRFSWTFTWLCLGVTWGVGSVVLLLASGAKISRFHWMLLRTARPAPRPLEAMAESVAERMQLRGGWRLMVTSANLSPFVWWVGGATRIVLPESACKSLDDADLRMVLAHEMAHIRRRDHWVRWLEWGAVLVMWWNPIMWWARKQLRITEEIACDALALEAIDSPRHEYASSLLNMAELLATSGIRPPAVASAMTGGGVLEKRLKMIIADKKLAPRWLRLGMTAAAFAVFPLGLVYAQDIEAVKKRLDAAVEAKELSAKQARAMLQTLDRKSHSVEKLEKAKAAKKKATTQELEVWKQRYMQAAKKIETALKHEQLSREEAEKKLAVIWKELAAQKEKVESARRNSEQMLRDLEAKRRRSIEFQLEIDNAAKAGKLAKELAEKKLAAIEIEFKELDKKRSDAITEEKAVEWQYRERKMHGFMQEIEKALKAGKITTEDAKKKLEAVRKELFEHIHEKRDGTQADHGDAAAARRRHFAAVAEEIEAAVAAGKLSQEVANEKLRAIGKEVFEYQEKKLAKPSNELTLTNRKRRFTALATEIEAALHAGTVSKKDAEAKLNAARKELFSGEARKRYVESYKPSENESEARYYKAVAAAIETAVKAGKLSKKDAESTLIELRKRMFEKR